MNKNTQLNANDIDWPIINGETIDTNALKKRGFSIITNQFRNVKTHFKINGQSLLIPVSMPVYEIRRLNLQKEVCACGGYTTVKITKSKVNVISEARCHSSDHFNKSVGIKLATAKAVLELKRQGLL
jgi:hypothetical protein